MDQGFAILDSLEDDLPGLDTGILGQVTFCHPNYPPRFTCIYRVLPAGHRLCPGHGAERPGQVDGGVEGAGRGQSTRLYDGLQAADTGGGQGLEWTILGGSNL